MQGVMPRQIDEQSACRERATVEGGGDAWPPGLCNPSPLNVRFPPSAEISGRGSAISIIAERAGGSPPALLFGFGWRGAG
jgi:hypothetical protein